MSLQDLAEVLQEAERLAVAAGVPAARAATILIRAESELLQAKAESRRYERQFLLDLREKGATRLARENEKSRSWVYGERDKILNKLSNFALQKLTRAA